MTISNISLLRDLLNSKNAFKNQPLAERRYIDAVDELIIKLSR